MLRSEQSFTPCAILLGMSSVETTSGTWGPLSEPIHGPVPEGRPPYKDNAYLAFWDAKNGVYGVFHFSTSPNAEGRRSRITVQGGGRTAEIIESPEPGTFDTASISFDLDSTYSVDGEGLSGRLTATPHHAIADYNTGMLPELVEGEPLMHYQRAARVTGTFTIDGETVNVDGYGLRDRTWGYRDESVSFVEYIGLMAVLGNNTLACMSFMGPSGKTMTDGFWLDDDGGAEHISKMEVTRDASGLWAAGKFSLDNGEEVTVRTTSRPAGFWVPMGWERTGPTMAAYDEFVGLRTADGVEGMALVEQGQIRNIY
ncbi:MAG: hypothetical protein QOF76_5350 [Solirubrobacteraceae bacterium]|nr:hypothetical protein [Solirubrobacteraceae bacterium]